MYGIALEGGGAKGAYHIGFYKAILELGLEIGAVTGTSIGALNGAMIVQNDFELAYQLWTEVKASTLFDIDDEYLEQAKNWEIDWENMQYFLNKFKGIMLNKGLDTKKIRTLLDGIIDEEKIRASRIDFGMVTVSLSDLKPIEIYIEDIPQDKLLDYLMASANFPAFKTEKIDGKFFVDGGIYDNLPINLLAEKGYKDIIAVRTNGMGIRQPIKQKDLNIIYIEPKVNLASILDFDSEKIKYAIELGYLDTLKYFRNLKGEKYYIEGSEAETFERLLALEESKIIEVGGIFDFKGMAPKRMLLEQIIPQIAGLLEVDKKGGYLDVVVAVFENIGVRIGIEPLKIYDIEDFQNLVIAGLEKLEIREKAYIPKIIKANEILGRAVKDSIIEDVVRILFLGKKENL